MRTREDEMYEHKHFMSAPLIALQHLAVGGGGFGPLTAGKQARPSLPTLHKLIAETMP
jgi:hypothetical protein